MRGLLDSLYEQTYVLPHVSNARKQYQQRVAVQPECDEFINNIPQYFEESFKQGRTWVKYGNTWNGRYGSISMELFECVESRIKFQHPELTIHWIRGHEGDDFFRLNYNKK